MSPHHKRRRPKHQRAGCLRCKPHKDERAAKALKNGEAKDATARVTPCVLCGWTTEEHAVDTHECPEREAE